MLPSLVEEGVHHVDEVGHALVDGAAKDAGVEVLGAALHLDEEVADAPEAEADQYYLYSLIFTDIYLRP